MPHAPDHYGKKPHGCFRYNGGCGYRAPVGIRLTRSVSGVIGLHAPRLKAGQGSRRSDELSSRQAASVRRTHGLQHDSMSGSFCVPDTAKSQCSDRFIFKWESSMTDDQVDMAEIAENRSRREAGAAATEPATAVAPQPLTAVIDPDVNRLRKPWGKRIWAWLGASGVRTHVRHPRPE